MTEQFELYPYQVDTVNKVHDAMMRGVTRILYELATALGKTVCFSALCDDFLMMMSDLNSEGKKVLVLAHRKELIMGAYRTIQSHCGLSDYLIGAEKADEWHAPRTARVVVGSVPTLQRDRLQALLQWFQPDVIITDESHHATSDTYMNIFRACGVFTGKCVLIGCTATPYRSDKQQLYIKNHKGEISTVIDKNSKEEREATEEDCLFQEIVCQYDMKYGLIEGYLCDVLPGRVLTGVDLSKVKKDKHGEYQQAALSKAIDLPERTLLTFHAWEKAERMHNGHLIRCKDQPTMVFCASVEHAHNAAQEWQEHGYTAMAVDGCTEDFDRTKAYEDFKNGSLQCLFNYGVYLEGTDLPNIGCLVMLRSTGYIGLYKQMVGRGVRTLPGILKGLNTQMERLNAIFNSAKPFCFLIDAVDVDRRVGGVCSTPNLIGLPSELDLDGVTLLEADETIKKFEEVKERVIGEKPKTFTDLVARLEWVDMLRKSAHRQADDWAVTDQGFRMVKGVPVGKGYQAELLSPNAGEYKLLVTIKGQDKPILSRVSKPGRDFDEYLLAAAKQAQDAIAAHNVVRPKGTLALLTYKQVNCLKANGHTLLEIDAMTGREAKQCINQYMDRWKQKQTAQEAIAV